MNAQVQTTDVTVRSAGGTYQTNTVQGMRASCTAGDKNAAQRLGEKLYGASLVTVEPLPRGSDHTITHWRLHAEPVYAWAWQSGLIEIGREVPEGALSFATGMEPQLVHRLVVLARHGQGRSEGKLLVPGVPEAETGDAKADALIAWVDWCAKGNGKKENGGVVFTYRQDGRS